MPRAAASGGTVDWQLWEELVTTYGREDAMAIVMGRPGGTEWLVSHGIIDDPTGAGGAAGPSWRPGELELEQERLALQERQVNMNRIADELEGLIRAGEVDRETALTRFQAQVQALSEVPSAVRTLSEYAVPEGTTHLPGFEPGGLAATIAGKTGLPPESGVISTQPYPVDPMAAFKFAGGAQLPSPISQEQAIQQAFEQLRMA